jgi:hypothetical protein
VDSSTCFTRSFTKLQKNLIPQLSQLICRATVRCFGDTGCDYFFAAHRPFRETAKVLPPRRDRTRKVLHEMLNASLSTGQMEKDTRVHHSPTKTRSRADQKISRPTRTDNASTNYRDAPYWFVKSHVIVSLNFVSASYTWEESVSHGVCFVD